MQEERKKLMNEVSFELSMICTLSKLLKFAWQMEAEEIIGFGCVDLTLEDIEKRYWKICEGLEQAENLNKEKTKFYLKSLSCVKRDLVKKLFKD